MNPDEAQTRVEELMATHSQYTQRALQAGHGGVWFQTPKATIFAVELSKMMMAAHLEGREQVLRSGVVPAVRILNRFINGDPITDEDRKAFTALRNDAVQFMDRHEIPRGDL